MSATATCAPSATPSSIAAMRGNRSRVVARKRAPARRAASRLMPDCDENLVKYVAVFSVINSAAALP